MRELSPELVDFLTRIHSNAMLTLDSLALADLAIENFYRYIEAIGIEFCNLGAFDLEERAGKVNEFSGTNMPACWLEEYFERGLFKLDYVMRRANLLTPESPYAVFDYGIDLVDKLPEYEGAEVVLKGAADIGMLDGISIIGRSPAIPGANLNRYFAFVFGGDRCSAGIARERLDELNIAIFAMLDIVRPRFETTLDGFKGNLSVREKEMLSGLASGHTREKLATRHGITLPTVDMHLANLRKKLGAHNLPEAVAKGFRYGIL